MKNQAGDVLIALAIAKLFKESGKNSITLSEEDFENFGGQAVKISLNYKDKIATITMASTEETKLAILQKTLDTLKEAIQFQQQTEEEQPDGPRDSSKFN